MIAIWISLVPLYFTDVTCASAHKGHFSFASGLAALSLQRILFCSCSAFLPKLLTSPQVHLQGNGYSAVI